MTTFVCKISISTKYSICGVKNHMFP